VDTNSDSLLNNPRFLQLWVGQACSFVGDAASMVALVILVVKLTGSAAAVGGLLLARLLPTLASPLVGVYADRLDRRAVLVASDLVRAILLLAMVFPRDLVVLLVLIFLMGLARTLFNPTIRAAFPGVVGGGDLTRANALVAAPSASPLPSVQLSEGCSLPPSASARPSCSTLRPFCCPRSSYPGYPCPARHRLAKGATAESYRRDSTTSRKRAFLWRSSPGLFSPC
jgi:MFS transporter